MPEVVRERHRIGAGQPDRDAHQRCDHLTDAPAGHLGALTGHAPHAQQRVRTVEGHAQVERPVEHGLEYRCLAGNEDRREEAVAERHLRAAGGRERTGGPPWGRPGCAAAGPATARLRPSVTRMARGAVTIGSVSPGRPYPERRPAGIEASRWRRKRALPVTTSSRRSTSMGLVRYSAAPAASRRSTWCGVASALTHHDRDVARGRVGLEAARAPRARAGRGGAGRGGSCRAGAGGRGRSRAFRTSPGSAGPPGAARASVRRASGSRGCPRRRRSCAPPGNARQPSRSAPLGAACSSAGPRRGLQLDPHRGAGLGLRLGDDRATHRLHQARSRATGRGPVPSTSLLSAPSRSNGLEEPSRAAAAVIPRPVSATAISTRPSTGARVSDAHLAARPVVLDRVREQVDEHLLQPLLIGTHVQVSASFGGVARQADLRLVGQRPDQRERLGEDAPQVDRLERHRHRSRLDP